MSGGTRYASAEIKHTVRAFIDLIEPYTDRLIVAGSLRRRLPTVGDVEIVCVPRVETREVSVATLFGNDIQAEEVDCLHERLDQLVAEGVVEKRPRSDGLTFWGPKWKMLTFRGIPFDLFSCVNGWQAGKVEPVAEPERLGIILLIRTGPFDYSHRLVTPKDQKCEVGKKGNGHAIMRPGLLPERFRVQDGWLTSRVSGEKIPTPDEQTVYQLLGLDYAEPWERHA